MQRRTFVGAGSMAALGTLAGIPAYAQKITGDARILCGFPPGGTADLLCRILADAVKSEIGQNVIVETKSGASGFIANETVATAPADGRTVGLAAMAAMCVSPVMPGQKLPINVDTDLTPIANIAGVYNMLVFGKQVPFKTVPEMIAYAKANPGKINYGSAGAGTPQNITCELFKMMTGVNLVHVPYKGGAPAVADLLAGHVQVIFAPISESIQQIKAGKLRALAVTPAARLDVLADVPTVAEFVPGYEASGFAGISVPRGTPAEIVDFLNRQLNAALADPRIRGRIVELGGTPTGGTPAEFGKIVVEATEKWARVIKAAGIKAE